MRFKWKSALGAAAMAAALCGFIAPPEALAEVGVSISVFHQQLAPHGRWVVAGSYGDCWVPGGVAAGWAPYVDGQWAYTDYGWTWASNDPWGDVPYHYGTWAWVSPYGWVWVPGTVWAPAWVTWAYTDDFIGWAPVPPSFAFSVGGYVGGPVVVAQTRYVFVPSRQFVGVPVNTVRVAAQQNAVIFQRATKVTSFPVSNGVVRTAGLPEARVERAMGHHIERVPIERARTQPVPLSRAGFEQAKSIPVVAPKAERARAIKTENAPASRSANNANGNKPETRTQAEPKAQAQAHPSHEARPAPQRNAPPEQAQRQKAEPKPKSENPPTETHQAEHSKPQPQPKPKAKPQPPPPDARQAEKSQPQPAPRPNPEARPDSSPPVHEAHAAQPKSAPRPVQKQKPEAKPKPPEKEKPQGSDKSDQN